MKKAYIAGPISGDPGYKAKFKAVADEVRKLGLEPINPAEDAPEGLSYREYINRGLDLLTVCDAICIITESRHDPDKRVWSPRSKGARLEWTYACTVGLPIMMAHACRRPEGAEWIIEIPECWPGMFGEASEK